MSPATVTREGGSNAPDPTRGPGEVEFQAILERAGVQYTRPEVDPTDPANFDFKVQPLGLYVEIKRRMPGKLRKQMRRTRRSETVICLLGPNAPRDLERLARLLALKAAPDEP